MSREYMNGRWCVRCNRKGPTPAVKWIVERGTVVATPRQRVLDLGCGNCRNMDYLKARLDADCIGLDMCTKEYREDCWNVKLDHEPWPVFDDTVDILLFSYSLMFFDEKARRGLIDRALRCLNSASGVLVVELYPAKDSYLPTQAHVDRYMKQLDKQFSRWLCHRATKAMRIWECG